MKAPILAFVSIKGGVGKTTLALETAASLANDYDKKVLLVDANFSAPNVGLYLDLTKRETYDATLHDALFGIGLHNAIYEVHGFDVVPASLDYKNEVDVFKLAKLLAKFRFRYDFIILDSSPNYEELRPVVAAADKIFLVTTPDEVTLTTTLKAAKLARYQKTPVEGIIVNRIRSPRHEMNLAEIEGSGGVPVLARIKDHKKMAESVFHRIPMVIHDSGNCVSREVQRFAAALCGEPEGARGFFQRFLPFADWVHKEKVNRDVMRKNFYRAQL